MALKRMTLTLQEAAEILGIPRSTAYDHARDDDFAVPVIRSGSTYRVARAEVEALVGPLQLDDDPADGDACGVD
jgi:excisionase family DNA binding protein